MDEERTSEEVLYRSRMFAFNQPGTLLISCCVSFVSVRPEVQKSLQKILTLRSSEKMLHEQTLLTLEEKRYLSLGLLVVGLVV